MFKPISYFINSQGMKKIIFSVTIILFIKYKFIMN
jgi:hypothetical protein